MKKIVSMLLSVVMLCSVTTGLDLTAYAADTTITGKCGESATYSYNINTKTLTISGTGVIDSKDSDFPGNTDLLCQIIPTAAKRYYTDRTNQCHKPLFPLPHKHSPSVTKKSLSPLLNQS